MFRQWIGIAAVLLGAVAECAEDSAQGEPKLDASIAERALDLEQRVLNYRKQIASGEAELKISREDGRSPRHWKLWFDDDRLRMEELDNEGQSHKKIVRVPGNIFHRGVGIKEKTGARVLSNPEVHPDDWNGTMLFDLRKLGVIPVPTGVLHSVDFEGRPVGDTHRERLSMEPVELDDRTVTRIVMKTPGGEQTTRLWIDESRGPSLVRVEHEAEFNGKKYLDTTSTSVAEVDGVWFPLRVVHQPHVNGRPRPTETTELEHVRLNQGVADGLFTLESVGVEPGEMVNVYPQPPDGPQIWDGEKVTPINPPQSIELPPPANGWSMRRVLVLGNIVAAGLLLLAYFIYVRKRKQA